VTCSSRLGGWTQGWRLCSVENITVAKSKEVKTKCNLAESSKEGCGSKRVILPVLVMMMYGEHFRYLIIIMRLSLKLILIKQDGKVCGLNSSHSVQKPAEGPSEHGNESSGSKKDGEPRGSLWSIDTVHNILNHSYPCSPPPPPIQNPICVWPSRASTSQNALHGRSVIDCQYFRIYFCTTEPAAYSALVSSQMLIFLWVHRHSLLLHVCLVTVRPTSWFSLHRNHCVTGSCSPVVISFLGVQTLLKSILSKSQ
jgi:hypothetical protein